MAHYGTNVGRGALLSTGAALSAAAFLIPYKQASLIADAQVVALALLSASAVWNTGLAVSRIGIRWRLDRRTLWAVALLAVFSILGNICNARALTTLEPAVDAVVLRTQVVFVAIAGAVILGEAIGGRLVAGALITLVGLAIMRVPLGSESSEMSLSGILWALGAANSFGAMVIITRRVIHQIQPVAVNALRLWLAVAVMLCFPGVLAKAASAGAELWIAAVLAAFCGPFISRLCIMFALRHVTAAFQVLVGLSSPIFALVLGGAYYGTLPSGRELIGGATMLAGIAIPVVRGLRAGSSPSTSPPASH